MKITAEKFGGVDLVVIDGEIDMYIAPKVRDVLLASCRTASQGVVVDLRCVPYMDSSGIATLVEGMQCTRKEGHRFVLVEVQSNVWDTLKLAKLHSFFEVYAKRQEALESFS